VSGSPQQEAEHLERPRLVSPAEVPGAETDADHLVCAAVLRVGDRFPLQLRDDRPDIAAPGCWGPFSGSVEPGETGVSAMRREIREELAIELPEALRFCFAFWQQRNPFFGNSVCLEAFECDVSSVWKSHRLLEGQGVELFTWEELPLDRMAPLSRAVLGRWGEERGRGSG
jgi:8-oxo-dGTP pyrophosphatase MutT (NUDIX family)